MKTFGVTRSQAERNSLVLLPVSNSTFQPIDIFKLRRFGIELFSSCTRCCLQFGLFVWRQIYFAHLWDQAETSHISIWPVFSPSSRTFTCVPTSSIDSSIGTLELRLIFCQTSVQHASQYWQSVHTTKLVWKHNHQRFSQTTFDS